MQTKSIRRGEVLVEFTSKPLSGFGGLAIFFEFLSAIGFSGLLGSVLPEKKSSNNRVENRDLVMALFATVLTGGNRFSHVERIRHDEVVRQVMDVDRVGSADSLRRLLLSFSRQEMETLYETLQKFFHPFLLEQQVDDVLDLDSTLFARYGSQEGVGRAFNSTKSSVHGAHHPLLGMLANAHYVLHTWLRDGSASTLRGGAEFVDEVFARLPQNIKITAIRADSGFHSEQYIQSFEKKGLNYIIAVRMHPPLKRLAPTICESDWKPLREDVDVAEIVHKQPNWARARRLILLRRHIRKNSKGQLFEMPFFEYDAFVTTLTYSMEECVKFYNQRGNCENTIKELKNDFGAAGFSMQSFDATELALRLITILFNLVSEFKRHVLRDRSVTLGTIRMKVFVVGAVIGSRARKIVLRLGANSRWREHLDTLLSRASAFDLSTAAQLSGTA